MTNKYTKVFTLAEGRTLSMCLDVAPDSMISRDILWFILVHLPKFRAMPESRYVIATHVST